MHSPRDGEMQFPTAYFGNGDTAELRQQDHRERDPSHVSGHRPQAYDDRHNDGHSTVVSVGIGARYLADDDLADEAQRVVIPNVRDLAHEVTRGIDVVLVDVGVGQEEGLGVFVTRSSSPTGVRTV